MQHSVNGEGRCGHGALGPFLALLGHVSQGGAWVQERLGTGLEAGGGYGTESFRLQCTAWILSGPAQDLPCHCH